jgi:hypothetical protein
MGPRRFPAPWSLLSRKVNIATSPPFRALGPLFPQPNDDINLALLGALRRPNPFLNIQFLVATGVSETKRINAMATLKTDAEEILTFDVSDEALESAGTVGNKTNFTFGVCTLDQPGCFPSMIPNEGQ